MLAPAWAQPARTARQTFVIGDFDTIRMEAPVDVTVVSGKGASATGTGDRATLDALTLQMSSRVLTVRLNRDMRGVGARPLGTARIALTTGTLARASVSGAGTLTVDRLKGDTGEATLRGSGSLAVATVAVERLRVGMLGAGTITLAGRAGDAMVTLAGSGKLDAAALAVRRLRFTGDGAATAVIATADTADVNASGAVQVDVAGTAKCAVRMAGSAKVRCGGTDF